MPRYFTHHYAAEVLCDDEGEKFETLAGARDGARRSASELIAEQIVNDEVVDLAHRLVIMDENGSIVFVLEYSKLFTGPASHEPS